MPENKLPVTPDYQALAQLKYAALKLAVEAAGFFAPHVVGDELGDHITCTSKHAAGDRYTGRIVFVTEFRGRWFFATPHPYHYCVLDSSQIVQALLAFLGGGNDRSDEIVRITHDEYEEALGRG